MCLASAIDTKLSTDRQALCEVVAPLKYELRWYFTLLYLHKELRPGEGLQRRVRGGESVWEIEAVTSFFRVPCSRRPDASHITSGGQLCCPRRWTPSRCSLAQAARSGPHTRRKRTPASDSAERHDRGEEVESRYSGYSAPLIATAR